MLVAFYYGDHKKDGLLARLGYALIRLGQIGETYGHLTHCEAILSGDDCREVVIASASVRDGRAVRVKTTGLVAGRWVVLDAPAVDVGKAREWFDANDGRPYSMAGAVASALWAGRALLWVLGRLRLCGMWCSRAVGESAGLAGSADMSVSELAAVLWSLPGTRDVTAEFFAPVA